MATFVLVHGSFHGGWCWAKIEPRLREHGHDVYTPTLTGLGERSHLASPRVGLDLHVQDVANVFEYEDLEDVVLLGHSYGGMVVTGVAEVVADRVAHLVYLDGFLPEDGQSSWDIVGGTAWEAAAAEEGFGWLVPPMDPEAWYHVGDPDDLAWLRANLEPMPLRTHVEPLSAPDERSKDLPRTFISCLQYDTFRDTAQKARDEGLDYHELDTGHDAMVTAPAELSELLLEVAAGLE